MPNEVTQLKLRVQQLEDILKYFIRTSEFRFLLPIKGGADGLKIGTATTDKMSFYDADPIVQPATTGETAGHFAVGGTAIKDQDTFDGYGDGIHNTAYTIQDIVKHLKRLGLLKN
jgi:hypothetical protein